MTVKFYSLAKQMSLFTLLALLSWAVSAQTVENTSEKIDMGIFYSSTHHWYDFFTDSYLISPLPGKPQYKESQITEIADNILLFQRDNGGWEKNYDMQAILNAEQKEIIKAAKPVLHTTFDNSTTHTHVAYLAKAYSITKQERFKEGCLKGINFILDAQYDNGGWPQYYPPLPENNKYSTHITYNDEAYVGIMRTLKCIVDNDPSFSFVGNAMRKKVQEAFEKGVDCILKTQIVEDGVLKVWCQQHDENTLLPTWARTFEPPCIGNDDSAPIVLLLMSIDNPSDKIIASVQGAVKWFDQCKILNTWCISDPTAPAYSSKFKVHHYDRRVVHDVNAPPIWTRYSELKTGKPLFCDRSGEILYNMSDLGRERRSGYRWYSYAPQAVMDKYPEWQQKWAKENNVLDK